MLYSPRESGQGLVEYALILSLVVLIVIILVVILGESIVGLYDYGITALLEVFT